MALKNELFLQEGNDPTIEDIFRVGYERGIRDAEVIAEIKSRKYKTINDIQKAKEDSRIIYHSATKILLFKWLITIEDTFK